jgi:hypothetical protein
MKGEGEDQILRFGLLDRAEKRHGFPPITFIHLMALYLSDVDANLDKIRDDFRCPVLIAIFFGNDKQISLCQETICVHEFLTMNS